MSVLAAAGILAWTGTANSPTAVSMSSEPDPCQLGALATRYGVELSPAQSASVALPTPTGSESGLECTYT